MPEPSSRPDHLLQELLEAGNLLVLSGAGISTDSGIPDYRGPSGAAQRKHAPMTYQTFRSDPRGRHRYWARSHLGWPHMAQAQPNAAHLAIAHWEREGLLTGVITQNVDGLHTRAGSSRVIDLHGRLDTVMCMGCGVRTSRDDLHQQLCELNPSWSAVPRVTNPDGDVELADEFIDSFTMVDCNHCDGALKPDVVYFGENVPSERVDQAYTLTDTCDSLLVVGSTLTVYSARRFVTRAHQQGKPIVIINQGSTRCDHLATACLDAPLSDLLPRITSTLAVTSA